LTVAILVDVLFVNSVFQAGDSGCEDQHRCTEFGTAER